MALLHQGDKVGLGDSLLIISIEKKVIIISYKSFSVYNLPSRSVIFRKIPLQFKKNYL
jgi:hypothetical protein